MQALVPNRKPNSDDSSETMAVPIPSSGESPLANGSFISADREKTQLYADTPIPKQLGRYQIEAYLGAGGFGMVYRARDEQLDRPVAIKVPHLHRVRLESERQLFLSEARTLAKLDHPGVVPVYDYGVLEDDRCFVVSKLIEGRNLSQVIMTDRPPVELSVSLLISVAETLDYVHTHKLIHRDIKPSNLLVDHAHRIYVADFGLALRETEASAQVTGAGTLHYMSPEQAGGEGHRIDCRTDLFSLGGVMYELLTGSRPFPGVTAEETVEKLRHEDPVPLTTHNSGLPAELNRICLKLLSKRASDRYQTGQELADDLKYFQSQGEARSSDLALSLRSLTSAQNPSGDKNQIVPRGLRSYDRHDAYFFLQLLPGPFDREGLPESISHWERWVKHPEDQPQLHRIGIIAGPSGCGKSSLIRAGLLPLLDKSVSPLIVEATIDRTETQLSAALDSRFPVLATEASLTDKLAAIRRGKGLPAGRKLLIVIDQFEQWLHTVHEQERPELVRALRQCDGQRIQCIVLVRDDFWLALNRFAEAVETPLVVGQNVKLVDLFDLPHARNVLTRFGRAYGRIPAGEVLPSLETRRFIDFSVEYLAKEGKVFPVHLSLFGEMVKARDWLPATLEQLGGAVGVGVQFLRESFSAAHAPVGNRMHEEAVRRVMDGLLPEVGTQIKTRHRTREELLSLSGYGDDSKRFESLMALLEGQLKLISPVDVLDHSRSSAHDRMTELHYQLSHDFLVPSIREWLCSEQRKTYRGRCRLLLSEQAVAWTKQPTRRNLPLWRDWIQYRCLLRPASLNEPERRLLRASNQQLGLQTILAIFLCVLGLIGAQSFRSWSRGHALLDQLHTTSVATAPAIIDQLQPYRRYTETALEKAIQVAEPGSAEEFKLRLAQVRWSPSSIQPLAQLALKTDDFDKTLEARTALQPHRTQCHEECWQSVKNALAESATDEQRHQGFHAAILLASFDPPTEAGAASRWAPVKEKFLSEQAIQWIDRHPDDYRQLVVGLRPVAALLTPRFREALGQPEDDRRRSETRFLRDFHEGDYRALTEMSLDALPWQWEYLLPVREKISVAWLREAMQNSDLPPESLKREHRVSTAAALLLSYSSDSDAWNLLKLSPHPGVRAHLIDRMPRLGVSFDAVETRLAQESDAGMLSGLMLSLGNYPNIQSRIGERTRQRVRELHETHPNSEVHASSQWLMQLCQIPVNPPLLVTPGVEWKPGYQWRVTPEGLVMVRIDARGVAGIDRVYEICATEVRVDQFRSFDQDKYYLNAQSPTPDCPINLVLWPQALQYCNWLSSRHGLPSEQFCCPCHQSNEQLLHAFPDTHKLGYRMPTRAEWEYACRAGTQGRWHFGNDLELMGKYAWTVENSENKTPSVESGYSFSHPVGTLKPNGFGIFDLYGNIQEWCADGPGNTTDQRYVLGGSHPNPANDILTSGDVALPTNSEWNRFGFRMARTVSTAGISLP